MYSGSSFPGGWILRCLAASAPTLAATTTIEGSARRPFQGMHPHHASQAPGLGIVPAALVLRKSALAMMRSLRRERERSAFCAPRQREALEDGSRVAEVFGRSVDEAVAAFGPAAAKAGISPERLLLDLAAICWYPFAHEHTLMPALGIKARDPAFLDEQKRHLGDLVRAMTRPRA
jgi:hypothetical protein